MDPLRRVAPLALTVVLAAGTLTGCGAIADRVGEAAAEKALEGAIDADIDVDEGNEEVTITGDDGSVKMGTKLPDEWPSSIPLPADHVVASAMVLEGGEGSSITAVLQVPGGEFDDVVAELDSAFAGSEWTAADDPITSEIGENGEIRMWARQFTSGDQKVHVQVQKMEDELNVLYQAGAATES